jgi:ATP-dependent DNA ligase
MVRTAACREIQQAYRNRTTGNTFQFLHAKRKPSTLGGRPGTDFSPPSVSSKLKYDVFRAIARVERGRAELMSRRNNVYKSFGPLCAEIAAGFAHDVLLDGEIVYLDAEGRPPFYELLRRRTPVC